MKSSAKFLWVFLTLLAYCFYFHEDTAFASPEFVDECLENLESCEEPIDESPAETDESENDLLGQEPESSSIVFEMIKIFFALLLVLALIYLFLYFLKRKNKLGNRIKSLENIGGISVGQNKTIQLIRLEDRLYLIGVGESITLLQEIEDDRLLDKLMTEFEEEAAAFSADTILSVFQKKNAGKDNKKDDFKHLFNQELNSIRGKQKNIINRHKEDHNE